MALYDSVGTRVVHVSDDVVVVEMALYDSVGTPEAQVAVFVGVAAECDGHLKEEKLL